MMLSLVDHEYECYRDVYANTTVVPLLHSSSRICQYIICITIEYATHMHILVCTYALLSVRVNACGDSGEVLSRY